MILGDSRVPSPQQLQGQRRVTIDEVFRRIASKHPDKLALVDAPNRRSFTDGAPRRLTYAEADRMVSAIAGRLRRMGMTTDDIVGIQLPNIAENILTILGVLRAGMIAALLPCFWIYWDVGSRIAKRAATDNPYRAWIDTYADEGFGEAVRTVIGITDRAAAATTPAIQARMMTAFTRSTQYEWLFWDGAYQRRDWPALA